MTRKELINSPEYKKENAYIDAWRDGHKEAVDKACEWLKYNFNMPDDFESHFRKAMEEQQ